MNDTKYIGLDVHQAMTSATVLDFTGKLVMEAILETKAATTLQFIHGLRGDLHVTFEEGTCTTCLSPIHYQGWTARKVPPSSRGRSVSLDIPFYRTRLPKEWTFVASRPNC
jgi:hypothetical protein